MKNNLVAGGHVQSGTSQMLMLLIFCLVLTTPQNVSAAHTYININNPFIRKVPVAVSDFKILENLGGAGKIGQEAGAILSKALLFTGYIKILNRAAFIEDLSQKGITRMDINFKNWTVIGSELLVTGGVVEQANGIQLKLRLFDTFKEKLIVGKVYTGRKIDLRRMVHRFCSEISFFLTGKRGLFTSQIVFVSTVNGHKEIFTCDFDGHAPKQVTHLKSITLSPSWSSDGQWLAYTSYVKGNPDLYIKNIKGKRGTVVGFKGVNITPDWVPGQFALAATLSFSGDQEIYLLTGKGKIIKRITSNWGIDVSPEFSPDGNKMAFVSKRGGTPQIYIKDLKTDNVTRLTFKGNYNTSPAWSPDGDKLAYVGVHKGEIDIYVIGLDGTSAVQLTSKAGDNEDPSWSPDGSLITFASTRGGVSRIYVMTAAGGDQRSLLNLAGSQTDPEWSLENVLK